MSTDQEIITIGKQLEKAVSENPPNEQTALDLLKELQRLPMSLELLQQSRVGLSVNTLRKKSKGSEVASFGKKLIKQWKKLVPANKLSPPSAGKETKSIKELRSPTSAPVSHHPATSSSSKGCIEQQQAMDSHPPNLTISPQTARKEKKSTKIRLPSPSLIQAVRKEAKSTKKLHPPTTPPVSHDCINSGSSGGGVEQQQATDSSPPNVTVGSQTANESSEGSAPTHNPPSPIGLIFSPSIKSSHRVPSTGDDTRDKCVELLYKAMKKGLNEISIENDTRLFNLSASIEECIFSEVRNTGVKYKGRVRSRVSNLSDLKNPRLKENVISGCIPPSKIAVMHPEEMASDAMKKLRQVYVKEAIHKSRRAQPEGATNDLLKCSRCGKRNCMYNQLQTLSGDEPITTFCYCNDCGHRWKFY